MDVIEITKKLISFPSITPAKQDVFEFIKSLLEPIGFKTYELPFGDVHNLYARWGTEGPHIGFAGHLDVVPPGNLNEWDSDPFMPTIREGKLYGRGASDMKGGVGSALSAAIKFIKDHGKGSISFCLTGDEEGPSINGTAKMLGWQKEHNEIADIYVVNEPTSKEKLGTIIKVGRRGSMLANITYKGEMGHLAYPKNFKTPVPSLLDFLDVFDNPLDEGNAEFEPSYGVVTNINVNSAASNCTPQEAKANFGIRFNNIYTGKSLEAFLKDHAEKSSRGLPFELNITSTAESFLNDPGKWLDMLKKSIKEVTGIEANTSTEGGGSDSRFIRHYAPVMDFGMVGASMHKINEHVEVNDLIACENILYKFLTLAMR